MTPSEVVKAALERANVDYNQLYNQLLEDSGYKLQVHETQKRLCEEFSAQQRLIAQQQLRGRTVKCERHNVIHKPNEECGLCVDDMIGRIFSEFMEDPDGPLVPLPKKSFPVRTIAAPTHDFVAALYRPYEAVI